MRSDSSSQSAHSGPVLLRRISRGTSVAWRATVGSLGVASACGVLVIMALIVTDVLERKINGGSIAGANEYVEIILVLVVFLGLPEAQRQQKHISLDSVVSRIPAQGALRIRSVGLLLSLAVVAWMTWKTLSAGLVAFQIKEYRFGLTRVPTWPAKLAIPLGLGALGIELLRDLVRTLKAALTEVNSAAIR